MPDRHIGQWGWGRLKGCTEVELGAIQTLENGPRREKLLPGPGLEMCSLH